MRDLNQVTTDTDRPAAATFTGSGELREELRQFLSQAQRRLECIQSQLATEQLRSEAERRDVMVMSNNNESRLENSLLGALPQAAGSFPAGSEGRIDCLAETAATQVVRPQEVASPESGVQAEDQSLDRLQAIKLRLQQQLQNN